MDAFKYTAPRTIEDACAVLDEYGAGATVLSGGQSLIPMLRQRVSSYEVVIDINQLDGHEYIILDDDVVQIGCLARHRDVAASTIVENNCRILREAAEHIGDTQVRNRGTLCGSIAHADPAGDPPVLAASLDAEIVASDTDGSTLYHGAEFYRGFYETRLAPTEIVTEVRFPTIQPPRGAAYEKYEPSAGAYPVATVAAVVTLDDQIVKEARIYTGALEAGPTHIEAAEAELRDSEPSPEVVREAAVVVGEESDPIEDSDGSAEFKTELAKTLAKRAITTAIERARGN